MALPKLSRIRKALAAAVPPLLPILAYFLGVLPQAHQLLGPLVYVAILGELGAISVYVIANEQPPTT